MKNTVWFLCGFLISLIYVLLTGFLSIQIVGLAGGAVFDLGNQLVAVTEPNAGLLQVLTIAVASGAVLWVLTVAIRRQRSAARFVFRVGFGLGTVAQVVASVTLLVQGFTVMNLNRGPAPWLEGWITEGGSNSAVHVVLIVTFYLLVKSVLAARRGDVEGNDTANPAGSVD
ncbi:hypothetical protein [Cryobacterium psychrophilum]|uniref:Uncharacterized protein n=1 Tax=Cryobacterium psychrophilum TaxID=41988 RepID=A0A4Y8KMS4_9MICO|nr:hypothetical protein [Cryobacterium psychrophilum]TDW30530.1 hypothetical protein EDD25_2290 [Cryobacterium psychrophilum]TFD76303.1 hypothetical protein E3T53_13930 [Cryobacterium psychrophilum]